MKVPRGTHIIIALAVVGGFFLVAFTIGFFYPELSAYLGPRLNPPRVDEYPAVSERMTFTYALQGPVAAEAVESVLNDDRVRAAVARKAPRYEINRALSTALANEATRQQSRADELEQSITEMNGKGQRERAKDLQWMLDAHTRTAADLTNAAADVRTRSDGPAADGSLAELLSVAAGDAEPRTQDLRRFSGLGSTSEFLTAAQAVDGVLAFEAQRALASRQLEGVETEKLTPVLQSELRDLLRDKSILGPMGWRIARDDAADDVAAHKGSGGGYEGQVTVDALTQVTGYKLIKGKSDMTLNVDASSVNGKFGGRYRGEDGKSVAVVRGRFKGKLSGDTLTGEGKFLLTESSDLFGEYIEEGIVEIVGLRVTNDAFVGSLTLKPQHPAGPDRTIVWSSDL